MPHDPQSPSAADDDSAIAVLGSHIEHFEGRAQDLTSAGHTRAAQVILQLLAKLRQDLATAIEGREALGR
jgi:hypothetical protein